MPSRNGETVARVSTRRGAASATTKARKKVRVAIIGVGNCASSLVQGVHYYRNAKETDNVPGLMHVNLGGYHISDIEFVAAFDIDKEKVGRDLSDAIFRGQNNTVKFAKVPRTGVKVSRGMTHDGLGKYLKEVIHKAPGHTEDVVQILRDSRADVLINYLPVGSEAATRWYMEQALTAGVAVVNCMPVFIARESYWQERFEKAGLPIIGDDIKSQVGATIVHRVLTRLFEDRGVELQNTYQLNFGGNTDFLNMLERERLESKKISKTNAVTSQLDDPIDARHVHVGPSDYVPWLNDRKWAFIRLEGKSFGDVPLNMELKLEVHDSPNSAGIVIDAIRFCKLALDKKISGSLFGPSSWLMKSPPQQYHDDVAHRLAEEFIANPVAGPVVQADTPRQAARTRARASAARGRTVAARAAARTRAAAPRRKAGATAAPKAAVVTTRKVTPVAAAGSGGGAGSRAARNGGATANGKSSNGKAASGKGTNGVSARRALKARAIAVAKEATPSAGAQGGNGAAGTPTEPRRVVARSRAKAAKR
jgi:myo-inositol-1-phosphate synthase